MQKITAFLLLSSLYIAVSGHTVQTNVVIGGQTFTNCLRPAYPGNLYSSTRMGDQWPIMSSTFLPDGLLSANYTCGFMPWGGQASPAKCTVAAGSNIGVSFYHGANSDEDPVLDQYIARSHKGPFIAYLAKSNDGAGNVWFKIYQSGQTQTSTNFNNVKWASPDTLIANSGTIYFTIPSDISPGNYLLRSEIIALHDTSPRGAQPYVRCAELTITGSGTANPTGVSIPGAYSYNDPGLVYNIYNNYQSPYPFPGPPVYVPGTSPITTGNNQVTTGRSQITTGRSQVTTGRSQVTGNQATTASGGRPCSSNAECPSNICTIDGICYVSGIPCDENTDCDSGICTIDGYCLESTSSASVVATSVMLAVALMFF